MNIQEVHTELTQWLKDLDFLDLERRFLRKIVKDYLAGSGLISQKVVSDFQERLDQLGMDIHSLRTDIVSDHTRIELIIKDMVDKNWDDVRDQQMILHNRYDSLFSAFQKFKAELFQLTSQIIEEEAMD